METEYSFHNRNPVSTVSIVIFLASLATAPHLARPLLHAIAVAVMSLAFFDIRRPFGEIFLSAWRRICSFKVEADVWSIVLAKLRMQIPIPALLWLQGTPAGSTFPTVLTAFPNENPD